MDRRDSVSRRLARRHGYPEATLASTELTCHHTGTMNNLWRNLHWLLRKQRDSDKNRRLFVMIHFHSDYQIPLRNSYNKDLNRLSPDLAALQIREHIVKPVLSGHSKIHKKKVLNDK